MACCTARRRCTVGPLWPPGAPAAAWAARPSSHHPTLHPRSAYVKGGRSRCSASSSCSSPSPLPSPATSTGAVQLRAVTCSTTLWHHVAEPSGRPAGLLPAACSRRAIRGAGAGPLRAAALQHRLVHQPCLLQPPHPPTLRRRYGPNLTCACTTGTILSIMSCIFLMDGCEVLGHVSAVLSLSGVVCLGGGGGHPPPPYPPSAQPQGSGAVAARLACSLARFACLPVSPAAPPAGPPRRPARPPPPPAPPPPPPPPPHPPTTPCS